MKLRSPYDAKAISGYLLSMQEGVRLYSSSEEIGIKSMINECMAWIYADSTLANTKYNSWFDIYECIKRGGEEARELIKPEFHHEL